MTIGQKIRMFRKERHLTLRELGELAGFPNRGDVRIAQYENGSRIPKNEILNRIASALGVTVEELAGAKGYYRTDAANSPKKQLSIWKMIPVMKQM